MVVQTRVAIASLALVLPACANSSEETAEFLEGLARPTSISAAQILNVSGTPSLSEEQKKSLSESKKVLASFFSSLMELDGEPTKFMTSDFSAKFKSRMDVADAVGVSGAQIIQMGIIEVEFNGARQLLLDCYLLILVEGNFAVSRFASNLAFQDGHWRIDGMQFY